MAANTISVLLYGDVDAIKDFVFETSSLPQIRGGSQILIECEEEVQRIVQEIGGEVIYCSGGGFLCEVPSAEAENLCRKIENFYLEHTQIATVTLVTETSSDLPPIPEQSLNGWAGRLVRAHQIATQGSDFAQRVAFLAARVRATKTKRRVTPFIEAFSFGRRCEACGKRMAVKEVERREPEDPEVIEKVALCSVCVLRHETGKTSEEDPKIRGAFNEQFDLDKKPAARQAPDLDNLAKSARRKYVAFLYADGNDIGRLLQLVRSKDEFKVLSEALKQGTQQALFEALEEVCNQELQRDGGYWPFEIVNIGGDDVTLLIQAGYAWEVAVRFLEGFETQVQRLVSERLGRWPDGWPEKITASCGIAVADVKYPVRYLEYLASDLLKQAKRKAKTDPDHPQSAVTFLWLPTPVAVEKADPLMTYYRCGENENLTTRPYTLQQAKQLVELVEHASQLPRTLRYRWGEALEKGMSVSLITVYYDIARRKVEQRAQYIEFLERVGRLASSTKYHAEALAPLWQPYEENEKLGWRTALLDVLELAELRAMRPDIREEEER